MILHITRSAEVIGMAVAHQNDLHVGRIEAELLKPGQELRFDLIGAQGIDHQESRGRLNDVNRGTGIADDVDVVENLRSRNHWVVGPVGTRRFAEKVFFPGPHRSAGFLRLFDERLHFG